MARIDWIERRLLNWQRWKEGVGSGGLGYGNASVWDTTPMRSTYREATIPTLECEAADTDDAVQRLPSELKATVMQVYLGKGGDSDHARVLACSVATVKARIWRAHRMLAEHFTAREQRLRAERERVEQVQRATAAAKREF